VSRRARASAHDETSCRRCTHLPITTEEQIERRIGDLLQGALRRQWWTLYLDDDDVQSPLIMPMAEYPDDPFAPCGDEGTAAELLAKRVAHIAAEVDAAKVVFVWERPGAAESTEADRAWARALGSACRAEGLAVRAQLILHDGGPRWFAPDDYV
jgi:hypothetical protein